MALPDLKFPEEVRAKHKLEVMFSKGRTSRGPNKFLITAWDSSGEISGDGDVFLGFCPNCTGGIVKRPVPGETRDITFCHQCKVPFKTEDIRDWQIGKMTTAALALYLEKLFIQLKCDADIYLKFHKEDIRYTRQDFNQGQLEKARQERHKAIYTMTRILQDTQSGASISDRFRTFLQA